MSHLSILDLLAEARAAAPESWRALENRAVGFLFEVSTDGTTATISINDSEPIRVPCAPSTYSGVNTVHVLLDRGRPAYVMGPATMVAPTEPVQPPLVIKDEGGKVVERTEPDRKVNGKLIRPTWSGTWRVDRSGWDYWNTGTGGGRSDLYQGSSNAGSGTLYGLATYGDQLKSLGAKSIDRIRVTLVGQGEVGYVGETFTAVLQGAPHGSKPSGAPTFTGSTVSASAPGWGRKGSKTTVDLPSSIREDMRTGSVKSLGLVGSEYGALFGTSNASGMALMVDYTVAG